MTQLQLSSTDRKLALTILYIDDDADDLSIFGEALSFINGKIDFICYASGKEALGRLKAGDLSPDVIFLDLNMPELNGFEILQELRKDKDFSSVPVIIFSTTKTHSNSQKALMLGANDFIQKPNSYAALCDLLREFFI